MLVSCALTKLKKRSAAAKEAEKRKQLLRRQFFNDVTSTPEYRELAAAEKKEFQQKMTEVQDASKYEMHLWIDSHTNKLITAGMDQAWNHVANYKDELIQINEAYTKMKVQFVTVQKRSLQEVAMLREKCRKPLTEEASRIVEGVEFYEALEFLEPAMRGLCTSIIKEEVKKCASAGVPISNDGDRLAALEGENNALKIELAGREEDLENSRIAGEKCQAKLRDAESELDRLLQQLRDLTRELHLHNAKNRTEINRLKSKSAIAGEDEKEEDMFPEISPIMFNPLSKRHVSWCTLSETDCANLTEGETNPFVHTSELKNTIFGDLSTVEGGDRFVAFGVERESVNMARKDKEQMQEAINFCKISGNSMITELKKVIAEMVTDEKKNQVDAGLDLNDPAEEASARKQAASATKVQSLEMQLNEQREANEKLIIENQQEIDQRRLAEHAALQAVEKLDALLKEIEAMKGEHKSQIEFMKMEIERMKVEATQAADLGGARNADETSRAYEKAAAVARQNLEKLTSELSEMESNLRALTLTNANLVSNIAELQAALEQQGGAAELQKLREKFAATEEELNMWRMKADRAELQLSEVKVKMSAMQDMFNKNGSGMNFDEILLDVGLKDFLDGGKEQRVFDRLYADALRRLGRLEALTLRIHKKERLKISRVMDCRLMSQTCYDGFGDGLSTDARWSVRSSNACPTSRSLTPEPTRRKERRKEPRERGSWLMRNCRVNLSPVARSDSPCDVGQFMRENKSKSRIPNVTGVHPEWHVQDPPRVRVRDRSGQRLRSPSPRSLATSPLLDPFPHVHPIAHMTLRCSQRIPPLQIGSFDGMSLGPLPRLSSRVQFTPPNILYSHQDAELQRSRHLF